MGAAGRSVGEPLRKAVHLGTLLGLPVLRALPPDRAAAAAFLFTLALLPLGPTLFRRIARLGESWFRFTAAVAAFPAGTALFLFLFPERPEIAAGAWAILAAGDSAAWLAGRFLPRPALPWNRRKSVAGTAAFLLAALPAGALAAAWIGDLPLSNAFALLAGPALLGALVESLPVRGGDNLTVILSSGALLGVLAPGSVIGPGEIGARVPAAAAVLFLSSLVGLRARAFDRAGAIAGSGLAIVPWLFLGWRGFLPFLLFIVLGSAAGLIRRAGPPERSARHAAANLGPASLLALLAGLSGSATLRAAFLAAVAAPLADTLESEIGLLSRRPPRLITGGRPVAPGTNGAVTPLGSIAGAAGALLIAAVGSAVGLVDPSVAAIAAAAGFAGSLGDSVLGATAERAGRLTNGEVNFFAALAAALIVLLVLSVTGAGRTPPT
ncbi:MAG: DUF92 domain-containing protein [Candidatus Eisenbacteria bacterium]|nr:DUF92 domain-containing protein [Candidatus Eisenbacteria bacterium]